MVHIVHIERNIHIFLIYNVIYYNLLLNMITVGKLFIMIDFQENEVMPLLHEALQFFNGYLCMNMSKRVYHIIFQTL